MEIENKWKLWNHSIKDNNWGKFSYKNIFTINNLYDYYIIKDILNQNILQNTMLFLMREDIYPMWEDPNNIEGSCVSFKISSNSILDIWNKLILKCICEDIVKDKNDYILINGISISPKKEFNIIKIWFKENINNLDKINIVDNKLNIENCRFKKNI